MSLPDTTVAPRVPVEVDPRAEAVLVAPVRRLRTVLDDILDVEAHPDREPEEALDAIRDAVETFHHETDDWFPLVAEPR